MNNDMSVTQMQWRPRLIKLTSIPYPKLNGGKPTPLYIDPNSIMYVRVTWTKLEDAQELGIDEEWMECTLIQSTFPSLYAHCLESPEQVCMLRDKALGFESKPVAV